MFWNVFGFIVFVRIYFYFLFCVYLCFVYLYLEFICCCEVGYGSCMYYESNKVWMEIWFFGFGMDGGRLLGFVIEDVGRYEVFGVIESLW